MSFQADEVCHEIDNVRREWTVVPAVQDEEGELQGIEREDHSQLLLRRHSAFSAARGGGAVVTAESELHFSSTQWFA